MSHGRAFKLRGDQERRRFFAGLAVRADCGQVTATLIAANGRALDARLEVGCHVTLDASPSLIDQFAELATGSARSATDAMIVAAQLAELQAEAISRLAGIEPEASQKVLVCGVVDPGLFELDDGLPRYVSLCDAARLADLSGLNVADAFPARDVSQDGRGTPLDAVPLWLLLHDPFKSRLLVHFGDVARGVYLPASRDETGANGVWSVQTERASNRVEEVRRLLPEALPIDEVLLAECNQPFVFGDKLPQFTHPANVLEAASAAVLAMLQIDQAPANLPRLTGANGPRVLGRLTPGNTISWHRLLRDLAFARPLITPLRAAM